MYFSTSKHQTANTREICVKKRGKKKFLHEASATLRKCESSPAMTTPSPPSPSQPHPQPPQEPDDNHQPQSSPQQPSQPQQQQIIGEEEKVVEKGATKWCKHKRSCLYNTLHGLLRGFLMGYGLRATLALVSTLILGKKKKINNKSITGWNHIKQSLVHSLFSSLPLRFGLFLSLYIGGFKGVQCALRWWRGKEDGYNAAIAGGLSGLSFFLLTDSKAAKSSPNGSEVLPYALYLMIRSLEAVWTRLESEGYVKSIPNFNALLFALSCGTMYWAYTVEIEAVRPSYRRVCTLFPFLFLFSFLLVNDSNTRFQYVLLLIINF